jgi:acetyltransferase-like isoleucine patch superfamily enzyme
VTFFNSEHYLAPILMANDVSSLKFFGKPLLIRNIGVLAKSVNIKSIFVPEDLYVSITDLVHESFPSINVEKEHSDDSEPTHQNLKIPINSVLCNNSASGELRIMPLIYPWDLLNAIKVLLQAEVTSTTISHTASVAKTTILDGPCVIEDDVVIDDFCKIRGPTYVGKGSFIGMSSLIRNSVLECGTRIGFNCEIAKSYFAGRDKIAHQNVILDSVIGESVWFGGYSGTANVLLNKKHIRYEINNDHQQQKEQSRTLIDTGLDHFGAVVGNNCAIGASVIILPGREVTPNTVVQAGTIVGKGNGSCVTNRAVTNDDLVSITKNYQVPTPA